MLQFKLVLLGESGVGKSSLALSYVRNYFHEFQESTIGAAFLSKIITIDDQRLKLEIWDTAGQERYHCLAPIYYRGAHAAIVLYDITNSESFHRARNWIRELTETCSGVKVIGLVGNKSDLEDKREVNSLDAKIFADEQGLIFKEISSKTMANVNEIFNELVTNLLKVEKAQSASDTINPSNNSLSRSKCCVIN